MPKIRSFTAVFASCLRHRFQLLFIALSCTVVSCAGTTEEPADPEVQPAYLEEGYVSSKPTQQHNVYPTDLKEIGWGHYFIAFPATHFGTLKLTISSQTSDTVTVHLGEKLNDEGSIDRTPPGTVRYRAIQLPIDSGTKTYQLQIAPDEFNTRPAAIRMPDAIGEVLPFGYAELTGLNGTLDSAVQLAVWHPFNDSASNFHSSDTILDQIYALCKHSIKATSFLGVYVDGDRERIPYEADAYINQLSHYAVDSAYSMARYTIEYLNLNPTWPTEWILHTVFMAYEDYMYTGNTALIEHLYQDLKNKTLYQFAREDGLISTTNADTAALAGIYRAKGIKDIIDWPPLERDGYQIGEVNTVVNALHYRALQQMAVMAGAIGKIADSIELDKKADLVLTSLNSKLFSDSLGLYVDALDSTHASLHANIFPLACGMVPAERIPAILQLVEQKGMAVSVYGAQYLLDALYLAEADELALKLMTATGKRSWYNMIRGGSTITWEAWDVAYKENLDWNHAWGAAPANIIVRQLLGVQPLQPGFSRFSIKPQLGKLRHAKGKIPSIKGIISVAIDQQPDSYFNIDVTIPSNTVADVYIPILTDDKPMVNNKVAKAVKQGKYWQFDLPAGSYQIKHGMAGWTHED